MKKNVLLVISFCLAVLLFCNTAIAQAPTGVFAKASAAPQIDGVVDAVWADATVYNIDKPLKTETPTLGASGETTWQALWNNDGVYILLKVADNAFYPHYAVTPAGNNWEYDKPEIYFDVNTVLEDAKGPVTANSGHIQVAPSFPQGKTDGTKMVQSDGIAYAFLVTGETYVGEYFIPFSKLKDKDGAEVKKGATIGFDVQIIDRDPTAAKARAVWANNVAAAGESYNNMDACGRVTLQGGDLFVYATNLTLNTGGTITADNGTLQMTAAFEPSDASNQVIKWSVVSGTGMATISSTGLLTAVADGTVTVKAVTTDGSNKSATTEVVISGQAIDKSEVWNGLNLIKNWNFDTDLTSWSNWVDGNSQVAPVVVNGVVEMKVNKATDGAAWHYQFNQSPLSASANVAYTLKFKSWANVDGTPCVVDFEDSAANGNKRYGTSTDAEAVGGASEWKYTVNTTPQWFTFHVVFDKMVASTVQKIQWMNSLALATISLDSVLLIKDEYLVVKANKITLNTGGKITIKGGTLQMVATVEPADAANKNVTWSVSPEGIATISPEGLLTAVTSGSVTVKAVAADGSLTEATTEVVISGQLNGKELWNSSNNLIKNWNFDTDLTSWGGWVDGTPAGMVKPVVVDGVAVMKVSKSADAWHYQHSQSPLTAEANVPYTLKFKSWASADGTPCAVDFEDIPANSYNRYGTTTDPESADGKSEWKYTVNTTPQWFTFHVVFDKMVPTTVQKIQWMLSLSNETIYLDSVLLVK
ncbi:MAG TPA: Ig-like domain-containing protein, partial [Prolixibacteraceae bacterium]|nr:Ig-like domain-containing protein [Prolixibacteraceae bacterium]